MGRIIFAVILTLLAFFVGVILEYDFEFHHSTGLLFSILAMGSCILYSIQKTHGNRKEEHDSITPEN